MSRATQTLHTCDRCGATMTGPVGTRKKPSGWWATEMLVPYAPDGAPASEVDLGIAMVDVDLCAACSISLALWWETPKNAGGDLS